MRLKGVNSFEQHVEKVVVGAVATVVLAIVSWQFVGPKTTVRVGTRDFSLDQAYPEVEKKAKEMQGKIGRTEGIVLPNPPALGALSEFDTKVRAPVSRSREIAWTPRGLTGPGGADGPGPGEIGVLKIATLKMPAAGPPVAHVYMNTIHQDEVANAPELKPLLPPQMPYDKAGVSVEATFDGTALANVLKADPDGPAGDLKPMPVHWWDGVVQILAVELQRQERQPDGSWGPAAAVAAMPGRLDMNGELKKGVASLEMLKKLSQFATEQADEVRRPGYYSLIYGEDWVPPFEVKQVAKAAATPPDVERWKGKYDLADKEEKKAEDDIRAAGDDPKKAQQKKSAEGRRDRAKKQKDEAAAKLAELGHPIAGAPGANDAQAKPVEIKDGPLLASPSVRLWAHDVTAVRGRTYRYRLAIILTNPVFGHAAGLIPEQADFAKSPVVRSDDSPWSDPLRIPDDTYYFIVNAQDGAAGGPLGGTHAAAELYAFYAGYWRRGTVSLEPGDAVAGFVRIPDLEKLFAVKKDDAPAPAEPPRQPRPGRDEATPAPPPPGGKSGAGPGGRAPAPGRDERPPAAGPGGEKDKPPPIKWKEAPVSRDAYLLDVAAVPAAALGIGGQAAAGGTQFQAVLRDSGGQIVVRVPDQDRTDPDYLRISANATLGENALRPKEPTKKPVPPPTKPGDGPRPPPGGGGGGGKSGGGGG